MTTPSKWLSALFGSSTKDNRMDSVEPGTDCTSTVSDNASPSLIGTKAPQRRLSFSGGNIPVMETRNKSPWRSQAIKNNHVTSTVNFEKGGNSKLSSSRNTNRGRGNISTQSSIKIVPFQRKKNRKNKYRPGASLGLHHDYKRKNRGTGKNGTDVSISLKKASPFEPSNQMIRADNNFRKMVSCKKGSRLLPQGQQGTNGRLPEQQQENINGKRELTTKNQSTVETVPKKRKVGFSAESNESMSDTTQPRSIKRKGTPFKSMNREKTSDDEVIPISIQRGFVKAKRLPSNTTLNKVCYGEEKETFTVLPNTMDDTTENLSTWGISHERETSKGHLAGDIIASPYLMLKPPVSLSNTPTHISMPPSLPFKQAPLAARKDKTVHYEDDDSDTLQDTKRSRSDTWTCGACGLENADDESRCQKEINGIKCDTGRPGKEALSWGSCFGEVLRKQREGIKCNSCGLYNVETALKCISCDATLEGSASNGISESIATVSTTKKVEAKGTIGAGGFSFGGVDGGSANPSTISSTGFTFGGESKETVAPVSISKSDAVRGFKINGTNATPSSSAISFQFGDSTRTASDETSPTSSVSKAGGFKFSGTTTPSLSSSNSLKVKSSPPVFAFGSGSSSSAILSTPAPVTANFTSSSLTDSTNVKGNNTAILLGKFSAPKATNSTTAPPTFNFGQNNVSSTPVPTKNIFKSGENDKSKEVPASNIDAENKAGHNVFSNGSKTAVFSLVSNTENSDQATVSSTTTDTDQLNQSSSLFNNSTAISSSFSAATPGFNTSVPLFGNVTSKEMNDTGSKKKSRGIDNTTTASSQLPISFGTTSSSATSGMFGNKVSTNPTLSGEVSISASTTKPFVFGAQSSAPSKQVSETTPITFGNTSNSQHAANSSSFGSTPVDPFKSIPAPGPTFGSTPSSQVTFGSTSAPAAPTPSFGSVPFGTSAGNTQTSNAFGSTPGPAPAPAPVFGNPATVSAPGIQQQSFGNGFGSTPAASAQPFGNNNSSGFNTVTTFGTTPAAPFGSTMQASTTNSFDSAITQPSNSIGFGGGFGSTTPNAQPISSSMSNGAPFTAQAQTSSFSLGTGGTSGTRGRSTGRTRRIVKARRPK